MTNKLVTALALHLLFGAAWAQPGPGAVEKRELIYCADLMTHEEREAYRAKMQAARTFDEKAQIRATHQADMQARAASRGVAGQCEPNQGQGAGPGQGQRGPRR